MKPKNQQQFGWMFSSEFQRKILQKRVEGFIVRRLMIAGGILEAAPPPPTATTQITAEANIQ
jgi:hypothetical protein